MFDCLKLIDEKIYNRYLTVERNIKAASNSFYDAYLDMMEQFVRLVLERSEYDFGGTCGQLLMKQEIRNYFLEKLNLDEFTYNKMRDYTQKVNAHKHKKEKNIMPDTIVVYMKIFHSAICAFAVKNGIDVDDYDANYFLDIFGQFERLNGELKTVVDNLKAELDHAAEDNKLKEEDIRSYRTLLSKKEIEKLSLEEQTLELYRQISILKDIKLSSMEEKLNKTIDLLLELKPAIVENRIIARAVGSRIGKLIDGNGDVDGWVAAEKGKESE